MALHAQPAVPTRHIIPDLTPQHTWDSHPDDQWLTQIAHLNPEPLLTKLTTGTRQPTDPGPIMERDVDGWRAGRYVGEIYHRGQILEIQPRLGIATIASWISTALNVQVLPHTAGLTTSNAPLVIQLVAALWRAALLDAGRHALPRTRTRTRGTGLQIKGRLDPHQTITRRAQGHNDLAYTQRVRTLDNAASAAIVAADRILDQHLHGTRWRGPRLDDDLQALRAAVGNHPRLPSRDQLRQVRYTPITIKYRRAAELSWRIARNQGLRTTASADTTHGLLLDVAELWELFLVHCTTRATTQNVTHGTALDQGDYLLTSRAQPERGMGRLYPDIIISSHSTTTAIIDAKYKRLTPPRGVDRDDLYQLYAYSSRHNAAQSALVYPDLPDVTPAHEEALSPWTASDHQRNLSFFTVPVSTQECIAKIARWLASDRLSEVDLGLQSGIAVS